MQRLGPLILTLLAATLAAGGCGSSGSDDSKDAFIAKADALCEASKAKQEPLRAQLAEATQKARAEEANGGLTDETRRQLAQALNRVVTVAEASQARVQALDAPEADAASLEAIFAKTEAAFRASRAYGAALVRHDDAAAQAIAERANAQTRGTADLAARYGFQVCGAVPE